MKLAFAYLALAVALSGCQHTPATPTADPSATVQFNPEGVKIMQPVAGQRFTPTTSVLVSYDTRTGRLCRTYGWGASVNQTGIEPCEWLMNIPVETANAR